MIGVVGDIGVLGLSVYAAFWIVIAVRLRHRGDRHGDAVVAMIALLGVLGLVFDWWEQPPFTLFLDATAGLALTRPPDANARLSDAG
jgi:hypothetical protein